jgi:hypothetical protein
MYSVVLLVALSGSADVVELGGHKSCNGCSGAVVVEKSSCNGCKGGHKLFNRSSKSCNGCNGCTGCTGGSAVPMAEPKKEEKKEAPKKAA